MASRNHPKRIANYCCFLQSAGTHGSGIIVKFEGLRNANLLALKKRDKIGKLETDYALVTSHDTIPGLSRSELDHWIVSCQGIENGRKKEILSNIVCGVISCCGPESLFAGHTADATVTVFRSHHGNAGCDIQLNITILFLNRSFEELLQGSTVFPPVIPVNEYLDQNTYTQKHRPIIDTGRNSGVSYMYCDRIQSVKTALFSVVEQQRTLEHEQELTWEFERFQKLESSSTMEICHGSPVYLNPDTNTNEPLMIGVYVGRTSQKGVQLVVTFHGILRLLQGGLIPVLSVLRCMKFPKAWTGRWGYLVTPHIDQMERMKCSNVCEVLHFLLRERYGTPLVKLPVDLVDKDNEASLDLLCALFKHFESADNADVNVAVTKLDCRNEMNAYIKQLCKDVIHLLELGANMVTDRTSLVEKCLNFYNRLLDFKYAGITEQILCTSENLKLVENIRHDQRYKHSVVVQKNATDISLKPFSVETLKNQRHYEAYQQALKEGTKIELKYLKMLFFGPPRTGKTSMRRRLVGEILNLTNEPDQASTGTAEVHDVIVKQVEETAQGGTNTAVGYDVMVKLGKDKTTTSTAFIAKSTVIEKSKWSSVKALSGKEKSTHETDLDEELQLLYQFIYGVVSPTENKSPASPVNRPELNESRSPVPTPAIEKEAQDEVIPRQSPAREKTDTVPSPIESSKAGPNASISTPQKALSVREHELSAKHMEEIDKAFEAFDRVLRTGGQEQLKDLLDETILMNMIDTGGHPAFLEMLPALTMGPALYLIFFRLNQELKNTYQIQFVSENNENIQVGESSYTVEEVIFQALSSIACFSCTEPKENMPSPSHAAMLIGTHKDQLGCNPETVKKNIKTKDAVLQKNLSDILEIDFLKSRKYFLHHAFNDQLMFAIDNMTGDEAELIEVREQLKNVIKQMCNGMLPIPASWLMFGIFLRKMGKRTMSFSQCCKIGKRLKVRDTAEALWFLHHCIGTVMHFPAIEDVVICDPQVVFDRVTDLILNSFNLKQVSKSACDKFKETGQFCFNDIQKIARNSKSDHLPLPELVKLLEHLNIIAPIGPQSDAHQEVFFMPAVLKHATEEELRMEQSPTDPVPLMIHFKCGFVPVGVFCAMIANLVGQKDSWKVLEPRYGHVLYKNRVTFQINRAYKLTLISKRKWYEIYIARISTKGRALEEMCQHVLETVCDTLDKVLPKMKYMVSSSSEQTCYELGFKCPEHPNDDHLVINTPIDGVEASFAKTLWLNFHKENPESVMICSLEGKQVIDLRDTKFSPPNSFPSFADRSLIWFGEATEISSGSIPTKELNVKNIVNVLREAKFSDADWKELGLQLIDCFDSKAISVDHSRASDRMIETISQWVAKDTAKSWEKLAEAVSKVGGYGEATADIVLQNAYKYNSHRKTVTVVNQSVVTEADMIFTVEATGDDLQFQWQKDGKDIDSNDCLSSPTDHSSTLQIQCVEKGHYKCLVKSSVEESRKKSLHAAELQAFDQLMIAQGPEKRVTAGKTSQLEEKQHKSSIVKSVEKPAAATRKQSRGEEQAASRIKTGVSGGRTARKRNEKQV